MNFPLLNWHTIPNALRAIFRTVKTAVTSDPVVASPVVQALRETKCRECFYYFKEWQQCGLCTCSVPLKTSLAAESCPKQPKAWGPQTLKTTGL